MLRSTVIPTGTWIDKDFTICAEELFLGGQKAGTSAVLLRNEVTCSGLLEFLWFFLIRSLLYTLFQTIVQMYWYVADFFKWKNIYQQKWATMYMHLMISLMCYFTCILTESTFLLMSTVHRVLYFWICSISYLLQSYYYPSALHIPGENIIQKKIW